MRLTLLACLVFGMGLSMTSCQKKVVGEGPWVKKIDSEELSRLVIYFSAQMKQEKHVELEDSWAAYEDYIQKLCLRYSSQRLLNLYDARLLVVELVEELLSRINNHAILSFEVEKFPFSVEDLDVKITFENFYGRFVDEQYVGMVWLQGGCVHFYAFNRKDMSISGIDWSSQRFEPYFKSRELALIKRETDLSMSPDNVENPPKKPSAYTYDRYPQEL